MKTSTLATVLLEGGVAGQWMVAIPLAFVVAASCFLIDNVIRALCANKPWMEHVVIIGKSKMKNMLGVDVADEMARDFWVEFWAVGFFHGLGGFLTVPYLVGVPPSLLSRETVLCLAALGALIEVSWELTDIVKRCYIRIYSVDGHILQPNALLVLLAFHHSLSQILVPFANVQYLNLYAYVEMVFLLEGAAFFAVMAANYGQTLDVRVPGQLARMYWSTLFSFVIMLWTRGPHYYWTLFRIMKHIYIQKDWTCFVTAFIICVFLFPVIGYVFVVDGWKRLKKFHKLYWQSVDVLESTDEKEKRQQTLRMLSIQINSSLVSLASPIEYPKTALRWTKVRSAVFLGLQKSSGREENESVTIDGQTVEEKRDNVVVEEEEKKEEVVENEEKEEKTSSKKSSSVLSPLVAPLSGMKRLFRRRKED